VMLSLDFYTWQTLLLGIIPCVSAESCQTKSIKLHNHRM